MHMSSSRDWGQSSPRAKTGPSTDNEHHAWGYIEAPTSGAAKAGTTFFYHCWGKHIPREGTAALSNGLVLTAMNQFQPV